MKRILILLILLSLLLLPFSGCSTAAPEDVSGAVIDANGNVMVSDPDDDDRSTFDEENEIKTNSAADGPDGTAVTSGAGNADGSGSGGTSRPDGTARPDGTSRPDGASRPNDTTRPDDPTSSGGVTSSGGATSSDGASSESQEPTAPEIVVNLSRRTVSDPDYAVFEKSTLKILKSADFILTGNFYGCIEASLGYNDMLRLKLAGANILNTTGPAVKIRNLVSDETNDSVANNPNDETTIPDDPGVEYDQPDVIISFTDGTYSTLEVKDCNLSEMTGTIYSEVSLSIRGHGSGLIKNANQNAVHCLKSVEIRNVNSLQLVAPAGRGVYTKARYTNSAFATVKISSNRDAVKCDKFYMSGGTLIACSQKNDAIDANDRAVITDGILVADTADIAKNYGIKVRRILENQIRPDKYDTFELSGGTIIAAGGFNTLPSGDTSAAAYYSLGGNIAKSAVAAAVKSKDGAVLFAFRTADTRPAVLISSPSLSSAAGGGVWTGGSISGGDEYFISDNMIVAGTRLYVGSGYSGGQKIADL